MTPPLCFSLSTLPASASFGPRTLRAPAFAPTSQTCSFAFDPAAASVRGSSGDHEVEKTLPYNRHVSIQWIATDCRARTRTTPRSREVTRLTCRLPVSWSSATFQTLTTLSVPPVAMTPRICGLMSRAETAPSWADTVNRAGEGESRSEGSARASKFTTRPFSRDT